MDTTETAIKNTNDDSGNECTIVKSYDNHSDIINDAINKPSEGTKLIINGSTHTPMGDFEISPKIIEDPPIILENEYHPKEELSNLKSKKIKMILKALISTDDDELKKSAINEYGLLTDELRSKIWPKLVEVDIYATSPKPTVEEMENHPYYQQVILDVNRSLKRFPPSIKEKQRLAMQDQLVLLIMRVLVKNPKLHYYQGYHDICVTFLLVLGEEMSFHVINKLSISHLEVFMRQTMEPTTHMLQYMFPVIEKENSALFEFLEKSDVGIMFALSWLITWFGHVLNNYSDVVRLFDLFIVSSPWLPVYLSSAIVLYREKEIMQEECNMPCIHSLLSNIPDDLPFEDLIVESLRLFESYPPKSLDGIVAKRIQKKQENLKVKRRRKTFFSKLTFIIHAILPNSKITASIAFAAVVALSAVLYQTYKT